MGYKVLGLIPVRDYAKKYLVEFSYRPKGKGRDIHTVYLIGSFNSWSTNTPMRKDGERWIVRVCLREGIHQYCFLINNYKRVLDDENPHVKEVLGQKVSCITLVDGEVLRYSGCKGDGNICEKALYHDQSVLYLSAPTEHALTIRFRTSRDDVENIILHHNSDDKTGKEKMSLLYSDDLFDFYECTVNAWTSIRYYFEVVDGSRRLYYMRDRIAEDECGNPFEADPQRLYRNFSIPEWARFSVFYQIMPDRFFNGDPSNDPPEVRRWGELPKHSSVYGGDLKGIMVKLPYLKDLGVNAIYLTPLFDAPSFHKYDVRDYFKVDQHFGGAEALEALIREAHKNGIKVVVDGVFHHSGFFFKYFQDVIKNGPRSRYAGWFIIYRFPAFSLRYKIINYLTRLLPYELMWKVRMRFPPPYECFCRNYEAPRFNYSNKEVWDFVLEVAEHWVRRFDIDGWRLDVAHGVPYKFWRFFRERMKIIKPDLYIFGEVISYSPSWFEEGCFDGMTNYDLYNLVKSFFADGSIGVKEFEKGLARLRFLQPPPYCFLMFNFLDNHDIDRFLTSCKGDKRKVKLALIFLFTYIGIPAILYGDEVGLKGRGLHGCRVTMVWDEESWDADLRDFYKKLISLRKREKALINGLYKTMFIDEKRNILVYKRESREGKVIVILNNSSRRCKLETEVDPGCYHDALRGSMLSTRDGKLRIFLEPYEGRILIFTSRSESSESR
ncbi:MAG: hypothetical protein DRN91_00350 [Candidatus Alkanophagales archaeon]|nr:MAG: hypothetical protein DRN91_00350 [Candidatus Alkanophagales archaeon]